MKEITVTGGGLAGLALAVALRQRGVPVRVQEAGRYPRHRVCGEFISGVTEETLAFLGIGDLVADAQHHHALSWIEDGRTLHRARLPVAALGISRFVLDDRLQRRVSEMGGEVQTGVRVDQQAEEGRVRAAGRNRKADSPWIGLKAHVRGMDLTDELELHLGRNGYAGLCGIEDGWINVCGLFRRDRALAAAPTDLLPAYLEAGGSKVLADRVRAAEWRLGSATAVAGIAFGPQSAVPGVVCVGDAATFIPPFTGNGMSMALQSAETACAPLVAWSSSQLDWPSTVESVRLALARRFRRRLLVARALHPLLGWPPGRRVFERLSHHGVLPFQTLLAMVR